MPHLICYASTVKLHIHQKVMNIQKHFYVGKAANQCNVVIRGITYLGRYTVRILRTRRSGCRIAVLTTSSADPCDVEVIIDDVGVDVICHESHLESVPLWTFKQEQ